MEMIVAFILGAAIPSFLLWQKTREAQGLLDELLRKEGRRPISVPRQKGREVSSAKGEADDQDDQVVTTINPSPIDRLMKGAIENDTKEYKLSSSDKEPRIP